LTCRHLILRGRLFTLDENHNELPICTAAVESVPLSSSGGQRPGGAVQTESAIAAANRATVGAVSRDYAAARVGVERNRHRRVRHVGLAHLPQCGGAGFANGTADE